ncbi:hypothetical protein [Microbulbifer sp. JTAC008]|uniref:hypothetical protein n=1 Tax=unclassified Microbulbifer TaxID=2619833 RepID=UPI004039D776
MPRIGSTISQGTTESTANRHQENPTAANSGTNSTVSQMAEHARSSAGPTIADAIDVIEDLKKDLNSAGDTVKMRELGVREAENDVKSLKSMRHRFISMFSREERHKLPFAKDILKSEKQKLMSDRADYNRIQKNFERTIAQQESLPLAATVEFPVATVISEVGETSEATVRNRQESEDNREHQQLIEEIEHLNAPRNSANVHCENASNNEIQNNENIEEDPLLSSQ